MPVFSNTTFSVPGSQYSYSGTRIDQLNYSDYTLVTLVADQSGSVWDFRSKIDACLAAIVKTCKTHDLSEQVMIRVLTFDDDVHEVHGFKPLSSCSPSDYKGTVKAGGCTALLDATHNALSATLDYGKTLHDHHFGVNGVLFVLTDGEDNRSTQTEITLKALFDAAISQEKLVSLYKVLVGVQAGGSSTALMQLSASVGFDEFIELKRADAAGLGNLAKFATKSIALASVALQRGSLSF